MTESDWNSSTDPQKMLDFLLGSGRTSERKPRLFAVACCRRIWAHLTDRRSQTIVRVSEQYADGLVTRRQLNRAWERADWASEAIHLSGGGDVDQSPSQAVGGLGVDLRASETIELAAATFGALARGDAFERIWQTPGKDTEARWAEDNAVRPAAEADEQRVQASLLRDIFGPLPFRDVRLGPARLVWNDGTVGKLAQALYEERSLSEGTLDGGRLAILADALEEAGCGNDEILSHLRQQGAVHVRGCWAVDLLTGKL